MTNKDKFLQLVSNKETDTIAEVKLRIKNRAMLRESQNIAIKVLIKLDELGWSQKKLAKEMGVSPQQITKIVSGKENLTIDTQVKLQQLLDIPILASYYEQKELDAPVITMNEDRPYVENTIAYNDWSGIAFKVITNKINYKKRAFCVYNNSEHNKYSSVN